MTFGERLRSYRIIENMSQKVLAELLNVTPQTISKWENNLSEPEFHLISEMTKIFKITHDELFIGESKINYQGSLYSAKKDLRMKKVYNFFIGLCICLSIAMIITTAYVSTIKVLSWHFTVSLSVISAFMLYQLFIVSKWRNHYSLNPEIIMDVYENHLYFYQENVTVPLHLIEDINIKKYQFYSGIRVYENNGYLKIMTKNHQKITVRDIIDVIDLKKVIFNILKKGETK